MKNSTMCLQHIFLIIYCRCFINGLIGSELCFYRSGNQLCFYNVLVIWDWPLMLPVIQQQTQLTIACWTTFHYTQIICFCFVSWEGKLGLPKKAKPLVIPVSIMLGDALILIKHPVANSMITCSTSGQTWAAQGRKDCINVQKEVGLSRAECLELWQAGEKVLCSVLCSMRSLE